MGAFSLIKEITGIQHLYSEVAEGVGFSHLSWISVMNLGLFSVPLSPPSPMLYSHINSNYGFMEGFSASIH